MFALYVAHYELLLWMRSVTPLPAGEEVSSQVEVNANRDRGCSWSDTYHVSISFTLGDFAQSEWRSSPRLHITARGKKKKSLCDWGIWHINWKKRWFRGGRRDRAENAYLYRSSDVSKTRDRQQDGCYTWTTVFKMSDHPQHSHGETGGIRALK